MFSPGMELAKPLHISVDFFVDRVFYGDGIVVAGVYMIKIIFSDREHVLE